jgi:hypothetical protein
MRVLEIGLAIGLILAADGFAIAAGALNYKMAVEVNLKLPATQQIREWGWYWGTRTKVRQLHRNLYPGEGLIRKVDRCVVIAFLLGLASLAFFWKSGLFG